MNKITTTMCSECGREFGKNRPDCKACRNEYFRLYRRKQGRVPREEWLSSARSTTYCPDCKQEKLLSEFNRSKSRPSGYQNICRKCQQVRYTKWHYETLKADPIKHEKRKAYYRQKEKERRLRNKTDPKYKKMKAAHTVIAGMVAGGWLTSQPCEVCGKKETEAHHDDYDKPLDVQWLCKKHHKLIHHPS